MTTPGSKGERARGASSAVREAPGTSGQQTLYAELGLVQGFLNLTPAPEGVPSLSVHQLTQVRDGLHQLDPDLQATLTASIKAAQSRLGGALLLGIQGAPKTLIERTVRALEAAASEGGLLMGGTHPRLVEAGVTSVEKCGIVELFSGVRMPPPERDSRTASDDSDALDGATLGTGLFEEFRERIDKVHKELADELEDRLKPLEGLKFPTIEERRVFAREFTDTIGSLGMRVRCIYCKRPANGLNVTGRGQIRFVHATDALRASHGGRTKVPPLKLERPSDDELM